MSEDFLICKPNECHILIDLEQEVEARIKEYESRKDNPLYDISVCCGMLEEATGILSIIRSKKGSE